MFKKQMVLFVMLFVGLMSIPKVAEAGFFSKTTKYDVIIESPEIASRVETMDKFLTSKDPKNKVLSIYIKFLLSKTPNGMYRKLASADDTDSDLLYFVKANKKFCFNVMCMVMVQALNTPGITGVEDHLLLAVMQRFTSEPITDAEREEIRGMIFLLQGLSTYKFVELLLEPQDFYNEIKDTFDGILSE